MGTTSNMAAIELDPLFVKALKLLHSKSNESTDQLKQMLNDALVKKKVKPDLKDESRKISKSASSGSLKTIPSSIKDSPPLFSVKKELEKKPILEKVKHEMIDFDPFSPQPDPPKKMKLDPSRSMDAGRRSRSSTPEPGSHKSSKKESKDREKDRDREKSKEKKIKKEEQEDSESEIIYLKKEKRKRTGEGERKS